MIGYANDLSSFEAAYGKGGQAAFQAVIDQTNAAGGIDGHQLKMISVDTQAMPANAISAIKQLASDKAVLVGGLTDSNQCSAAQSADRAAMPLLCETAASTQLVPASPLVFTSAPFEVTEVAGLNNYLKTKLGTVHYGVLPENLAGELEWAKYLKSTATATGGTLTQEILPPSGSVAAQIAGILNAKPNAVILETSPGQMTAVDTGLRNGGYTGLIINLTADYANAVSIADPNLYEYNATDFVIPGSTPGVVAMTKALAGQGVKGIDAINETNTPADYLHAEVAIDALKACGGCSGAALSAAMSKQVINTPGLTVKGGFGYTATNHTAIANMAAYVYDKATKGLKLAYYLPLTAPADLPKSALG